MMEKILHYCPLEEAMKDFPFDFDFIRDWVFIAMLDYDPNRRTYAETMLTKHYGNVIVGAENVNGSIFLDVTDGNEVRSVYLADIPDRHALDSDKVHPFRLIE